MLRQLSRAERRCMWIPTGNKATGIFKVYCIIEIGFSRWQKSLRISWVTTVSKWNRGLSCLRYSDREVGREKHGNRIKVMEAEWKQNRSLWKLMTEQWGFPFVPDRIPASALVRVPSAIASVSCNPALQSLPCSKRQERDSCVSGGRAHVLPHNQGPWEERKSDDNWTTVFRWKNSFPSAFSGLWW